MRSGPISTDTAACTATTALAALIMVVGHPGGLLMTTMCATSSCILPTIVRARNILRKCSHSISALCERDFASSTRKIGRHCFNETQEPCESLFRANPTLYLLYFLDLSPPPSRALFSPHPRLFRFPDHSRAT